MTKNCNAVTAMAVTANEKPRLLMPVPIPGQPDWNERVARWAVVRG